jgi:hypothetical protein
VPDDRVATVLKLALTKVLSPGGEHLRRQWQGHAGLEYVSFHFFTLELWAFVRAERGVECINDSSNQLFIALVDRLEQLWWFPSEIEAGKERILSRRCFHATSQPNESTISFGAWAPPELKHCEISRVGLFDLPLPPNRQDYSLEAIAEAFLLLNDADGSLPRLIPQGHELDDLETAYWIDEVTAWESPNSVVGRQAANSWVLSLIPLFAKLVDAVNPRVGGGPTGQYQWLKNGVPIMAKMEPTPWRMCKCLWNADGMAAEFDELIESVYNDPEHIADRGTFGSLRRQANKFFGANGIGLRVTLSKTRVALVPTS